MRLINCMSCVINTTNGINNDVVPASNGASSIINYGGYDANNVLIALSV